MYAIAFIWTSSGAEDETIVSGFGTGRSGIGDAEAVGAGADGDARRSRASYVAIAASPTTESTSCFLLSSQADDEAASAAEADT